MSVARVCFSRRFIPTHLVYMKVRTEAFIWKAACFWNKNLSSSSRQWWHETRQSKSQIFESSTKLPETRGWGLWCLVNMEMGSLMLVGKHGDVNDRNSQAVSAFIALHGAGPHEQYPWRGPMKGTCCTRFCYIISYVIIPSSLAKIWRLS